MSSCARFPIVNQALREREVLRDISEFTEEKGKSRELIGKLAKDATELKHIVNDLNNKVTTREKALTSSVKENINLKKLNARNSDIIAILKADQNMNGSKFEQISHQLAEAENVNIKNYSKITKLEQNIEYLNVAHAEKVKVLENTIQGQKNFKDTLTEDLEKRNAQLQGYEKQLIEMSDKVNSLVNDKETNIEEIKNLTLIKHDLEVKNKSLEKKAKVHRRSRSESPNFIKKQISNMKKKKDKKSVNDEQNKEEDLSAEERVAYNEERVMTEV